MHNKNSWIGFYYFFFIFCFLFFQVHIGDGVKYVFQSTERENDKSKDALSSGTKNKETRILVIDADSSDLRSVTCASCTRDFQIQYPIPIALSTPTTMYYTTYFINVSVCTVLVRSTIPIYIGIHNALDHAWQYIFSLLGDYFQQLKVKLKVSRVMRPNFGATELVIMRLEQLGAGVELYYIQYVLIRNSYIGQICICCSVLHQNPLWLFNLFLFLPNYYYFLLICLFLLSARG